MSQAQSQAEAPASALPQNRNLYAVVCAVVIALVLGSLDNLILGVAMPTIVGELGGLDHLSWVVTAYTLTTAVSTPVWGKIGDMYGRKGVFLSAITIFLVGSAMSGMAQSMWQLICFRALQGLGGGGLMVGALAIISTIVPVREQGRFQGMISAVMGASMIAGPLAGGVITDHLGWRWCFYVNLPLGAVALIMITSMLDLPKQSAKARIDYLGVALLTIAISAVVLVTTWGGTEYGWVSGTILGLMALAVVAIAAFLLAERRAAEPVLPLGLFRNANFSLATVIGFLLGAMMFAVMTFLPLFQQAAQGASPTYAGLQLLPVFLAMMVANVVVGRVITSSGKYKVFVIGGGALATAGLVLLSMLEPDTSRLFSSAAMALVGAGMGCLMQTTLIISMQSVEPKDLGVASSTATLARTIGGSIGVSVMGALFAGRVSASMAERGGDAAAAVSGGAQLEADKLKRLPEAVRSAYEFAVSSGAHRVFLLGAALALVTFAVAWIIREVPLRTTLGTPEPEAAPPAKSAKV
ncbi:MDR family MFS transporter [Streptomyces sp. NPDC006649]|uniref:MDR family MFS transporter n=1 Tax=Streptomyces sp. NPDC006649 TaxID=3156896 RepID=UPI0033ABB893